MKDNQKQRRGSGKLLLRGWGGAILFFFFILMFLRPAPPPAAAGGFQEFGYGFNVAVWDTAKLQGMGFNSIKLFDPPGSRLPLNVLLRVDANASHLSDLNRFANEIGALAAARKGFVDAYEIGNEPNLDAVYGWGYDPSSSWGGSAKVAPDAADYVTLLCTAYQQIKQADPDAIVVSAGLAPTGRVTGSWDGHAGHNGFYQDEREFLREMLSAGGGACFDVLGYHPYGYSADFDAVPDLYSADPTQNCVNGFCFRGTEKIYEILQAYGYGDRSVWATEFGWITAPPAACLSDPGWQGRAWQIVSAEKQAENLAGAFSYATANWPWMGAMFIFNLNFNTAPWFTDPCEQMRYYGVDGRPAETALRDLPKITGPARGHLSSAPGQLTTVATPAMLPLSTSLPLELTNAGIQPLAYSLSLHGTADVSLQLNGSATGTLDPAESTVKTVQIDSAPAATGVYTASIIVQGESVGEVDEIVIPVRIYIWNQVEQIYLPLVMR